MTSQELARAFRGVAAALIDDETADQQRRVRSAITSDGRVHKRALPLVVKATLDWYVSGTLTVSSNQSAELRMPVLGRLERFDVRVKTAPTGSSATIRLRRNGVILVRAVIPAGQTSGGLVIGPDTNGTEAGDIYTIDVSQIGATIAGANLTATLTYRQGDS